MFLNIKTEYNFLQSLCKIDELIEYAKENEIHELGIVDDDFFVDSLKFILKCQENNIKPIVGVRKKIINFYNIDYITIYAKCIKGISIINSLPNVIENIDVILNEHLYIVFDVEKLTYSKKFNIDEVKTNLENLKNLNYYFAYNEKLLVFLEEDFILNKMIFDEEIRFLKNEELEYFLVLNSIYKKTKYLDEKKLRVHFAPLSLEVKIKKISNLKEQILNNTKSFINNIDTYTYEYNYIEVLNFPIYEKVDFEQLLHIKLDIFLKENDVENDVLYNERLAQEIKVIKAMNFENYFLIMEDIIKYLNTNHIPYGYGRGSAAGSLVSYLLNITKIDPIYYNLYFERFLNLKRISLPDIDLDISDVHRQEIISYLINKYGEEHVAKIFTINKYLVKSAFNDIAKSLNIDVNLIKKINSNLSSYLSFEENIVENYKFFNKYESDVKFDFLRESMKRIENLAKNISIHAAGVVISNVKLSNVAYVKENLIYCEAKPLETVGFVKFDLLALSTLSFVDRLEKKVISIDLNYKSNKIPLDYPKVYENLKATKTLGIFQMESKGIRKVLEKYEPKTLMDIAIVISLYRPGPMKNIDLLINNKNNPHKIKYIHEDLKEILEPTYGIIVFQEQIMEIVKKVASYSNAEADIFRVAISKKKKTAMENLKSDFILNGEKNGYNTSTLNKLYDNILEFAGYGFNKSHAISYARLIYQMMYIKSKYPTIFFAELFSSMINSSERENFLLELYNMNIVIYPPEVQYLSSSNTLKRGRIILSINNIKNIRKNILEKIIEDTSRNKEEYSNNLILFLEEVIIPLELDIKEKKSLVGSGLFDSYNINRKSIYNTLNKYSKIDLDILKFTKEKIKIQIGDDFSFEENAKMEQDSLGFNLKFSPKEYLIKKLNKKYSGAKLTNIVFDKEDLEINRSYFVLGQITFIKEIKTKKEEVMAFLTFKNNVKYIDITIFPQNYEKFKKEIEEKKGYDIILKIERNRRDNLVFEDIIF